MTRAGARTRGQQGERNFWRVLRDKKAPQETYDHVRSIFSATVICQDPGLFGMDVECPLPSRGTDVTDLVRGADGGARR